MVALFSSFSSFLAVEVVEGARGLGLLEGGSPLEEGARGRGLLEEGGSPLEEGVRGPLASDSRMEETSLVRVDTWEQLVQRWRFGILQG